MIPPRETISASELRKRNRTVVIHLIALIIGIPLFYVFIGQHLPGWLAAIVTGIGVWWCCWVIATSCN